MLQSEYCIRSPFSAHGEHLSLTRHFRAEKQSSYDLEVQFCYFAKMMLHGNDIYSTVNADPVLHRVPAAVL